MRILMIEDNENVAEMLSMFLEQEKNCQVDYVNDGQEGYDFFKSHEDRIDLLILDLNLPSKDGVSICREIRSTNKKVYILMLTARDSESDEVLGLGLGADDYITKPFSPLALVAKLKAVERRRVQTTGAPSSLLADQLIETKLLKMNLTTREVIFNGQAINNLTPKEFDLLALFAHYPKQVFTRENLLKQLWEDPFYGDERTVDAHIKKLRQKLEKQGSSVIRTVWGIGYKYEETEE